MTESGIFLDLVVAMLAVNRWSLERTAALASKLRVEGFSDPAAVRAMEIAEIAARLGEAGYSRGAYMQQLLAARILNAAEVLDEAGLARLAGFEQNHDNDGTRAHLLRIKGVGPEVIRSFRALGVG